MRRVVFFFLSLSACGLTARGSMEPDGGDITEVDATATDGSAPDGDAVIDAAVEAEVDAGPCDVTVEDPFATVGFDPLKWTKFANPTLAPSGYPKPVVAGSVGTAKFFDDTTDDVIAGLWHPQVVPFEAFDIGFDLYAVCSGNCGDGLAIVWLPESDATTFAKAGPGAILGIPVGVPGGAVALDLAEHDERGETVEPAMLVLDLDGTDQLISPYDWVVATSEAMNTLVNNGARRIDLAMRSKEVIVRVDGTERARGTLPHLPAKGTFGFTAASGAFNAHLAIGDVKAKFYRCNAP